MIRASLVVSAACLRMLVVTGCTANSGAGATGKRADSATPRQATHTVAARGVRVMHNNDYRSTFSEFVPGMPLTPPNALSDYVDLIAGTGVTDMLFNVNCQRVNYRSDVWEATWDGQDYGAKEHAFCEQGGDYPAYIVDLCRKRGMAAWLSIRMNDSHYAPEKDHDHPYHSTFWRQHPEWWVAP